uniref:TIR-like domain protein n=1 Tax=Podoviridae sp. ctrub15 TaxID=2826581 RepID=A0A8S5LUF9_9CAUD|nr:MAG TPA: TIR-like domain protein [Podoviridae sp. ctrub15]
MAEFRKIFPSYDWDQDVVYVNQIVNYPYIVGVREAGFVKSVPNEEVKRDDNAIAKWIRDNMRGCSCFILFIGEKTYQSKWCLYEMDLAREWGLGRMIIYLDRMIDPKGRVCGLGPNPYIFHNRCTTNLSANTYIIQQYHWKDYEKPHQLLWAWIEDACKRAGR